MVLEDHDRLRSLRVHGPAPEKHISIWRYGCLDICVCRGILPEHAAHPEPATPNDPPFFIAEAAPLLVHVFGRPGERHAAHSHHQRVVVALSERHQTPNQTI